MHNKILTCLFLIIVTLAVYRQVSNHEFINYDDGVYITENPSVKTGLTQEGIIRAFTTMRAGNWHPLTWLSHMLDVQLFGLHPGAHHLVNVLFHSINTVLLYLLLSRMSGAHWLSVFIAALFSLHPLHVESVAWAAERKDVLSGFFWILTLLFYDSYVKQPGRIRYLLTLGTFALGLMSKPMLVTLPVVLLMMDYWPLGRLEFRRMDLPAQKCRDAACQKSFPLRLILEKLPFIALSVFSSIITVYAQHKGGAVASVKAVPFSFRAVNALWAYIVYMGKTIWPVDLAIIYPLPPSLTTVHALSACLIIAGISVITVRSAKQHPYFISGWLWYLVTLVPVTGLVQVGRQSVADRYTYIPLIGLFIMAAWGIRIFAGEIRWRRIAMSAAAGLLIISFAACTWLQLGHWKNSLTLFSHAVKAVDNNYIAHESLGYALAQSSRLDEAVYHYSEALRVSPDYERALVGLGNVLIKQGKTEEAIHYTKKALLLNPDYAEAHFNMGFALLKQGRDTEAIYHYTEGLSREPDNAEIHFILGVTLCTQGKLDEGISHLSEALKITPDFAEARLSLKQAVQLKGISPSVFNKGEDTSPLQ